MIIAVVNQKGGTAKTTTTVNLGKALADAGKRVLLVDLDAQGSLGYSLGIQEAPHSIADVLAGEIDLSQALIDREGLQVVASQIGLADLELELAGMQERELLLAGVLQSVEESFDVILIDCPPSLSLLTVNALSAANQVIIPMQMEVLSLQGLDLISETITKIKAALNPHLEVLGILPVMVDKRRKLSSEVREHIQENYPFRIFDTNIRPNVRASEAPSFGQSVISYAPDSNSSKDYQQLANEVLNNL
ncbi:ParA family protein [Marinoscillum furvescens]|uniref:Chromosome partitioning protein n=1 Tax=Marinoscillum furvescens DSM 4134 TaxID=1122208 RepID=A0A3D9L6S9_MARFU|nr:ParA family protein [Marinoscillum furvescens]REE01000.1 chromosome partitioning protein [Marinoscillum furvescens DSM 4134]